MIRDEAKIQDNPYWVRDGAGIIRDGTAVIPASSVAATALSWTIRGYLGGLTDHGHCP